MAYDKQKVLNIALAEEGYLEKASKANLDDKTANAGSANITKYARDLAAVSYFNGNKQGVPWCATFVAWCYYKAYGKAAALKLLCQPTNTKNNAGAGCKYIVQYFKAKGQWHTSNPQTGDVIVFYDSTMTTYAHTGHVYKVSGGKVYTIEGNTSSASGVVANGGAVARKSYPLTYARIAGYGRPDFGVQTVTEPEKEPEKVTVTEPTQHILYTVKKGDSLWRIAQKLLGSGNKHKDIKSLNGLKSDRLQVGQVLKIPMKTAAQAITTEYTVKKGDTLWKIAQKQLGKGNRYKEIKTLNGLASDNLNIGQKLKIPKA